MKIKGEEASWFEVEQGLVVSKNSVGETVYTGIDEIVEENGFAILGEILRASISLDKGDLRLIMALVIDHITGAARSISEQSEGTRIISDATEEAQKIVQEINILGQLEE